METQDNKIEDLEGEIWKDIPNYEGLYMASNLGRVKSITVSYIRANTNYKVKHIGRIRKVGTDTHGYSFLSISRKKKIKSIWIHRIVAQLFIPNPENKPEVNHIDGDKKNNSISNLEWCTRSENNLHAYRTGLNIAPLGKESYTIKYGVAVFKDNLKIAELYGDKEIKDFGLRSSSISRIFTNSKYSTHKGFTFKKIELNAAGTHTIEQLRDKYIISPENEELLNEKL